MFFFKGDGGGGEVCRAFKDNLDESIFNIPTSYQ